MSDDSSSGRWKRPLVLVTASFVGAPLAGMVLPAVLTVGYTLGGADGRGVAAYAGFIGEPAALLGELVVAFLVGRLSTRWNGTLFRAFLLGFLAGLGVLTQALTGGDVDFWTAGATIGLPWVALLGGWVERLRRRRAESVARDARLAAAGRALPEARMTLHAGPAREAERVHRQR